MRRVFALARFAVLRAAQQRILSACIVLGSVLAVGIAAATPIFVSAAQARVLSSDLEAARQARDSFGQRIGSPEPFALKFSFLSLGRETLNYSEFAALDTYMRENVETATLLPSKSVVRFTSTDNWGMHPTAQNAALYPKADGKELTYVSFDVMTGIEKQIVLDEGRLPADWQTDAPTDMLEALISRDFSARYGVAPGEVFSLTFTEEFATNQDGRTAAKGQRFVQMPVRVTGIWHPKNVDADYWIVRPGVLSDGLLVSPRAYGDHPGKLRDKFVTLAIWSYALDESALSIENAGPLLGRAQSLERELRNVRQGIDLTQNALVRALDKYLSNSAELLTLLQIFSLPGLAVILAFVALVAGMVVQQQESELAILRSRGASGLDVAWLYVVQGGLLCAVAFVIGLGLAWLIAGTMLNIRTFLSLDAGAAWLWPRSVPRLAYVYGAGMAVICLLLTMFPALGAARRNILTYAAERARPQRAPAWQRLWLDVVLLVLCVYVWYQLRYGGGGLGALTAQSANPLRDPLRFLLPMLTLCSLGLLAGRLIPLCFGAGAALLRPLNWLAAPFVALRDLARAPRSYLAPVLLLVFTLGIATYGANTARTLDAHLQDTVYLEVGGDMRLIESGVSNRPPGGPPPGPDAEPELLSFQPVEDHLLIPNVTEFARVARIDIATRAARATSRDAGTNKLMAIERRAFQSVAQKGFRDDYTSDSFNGMLNALAVGRDGLLVQRSFLAANDMRVGERMPLVLSAFGENMTVSFTIRGAFDHFPVIAGPRTDYTKGSYFVANMDYVFEQLGRETSYDVLISTEPQADALNVTIAASNIGFIVFEAVDARRQIREAQLRPDRQGLFGMLSAGFVFMAVLTLTGFMVYALLTQRRRSIELGVLRALGFSAGQMAVYLGISQVALVLLGTVIGCGIGLLVSWMYVPLQQVGGNLIASVPPFLTRYAWDSIFVLLLAVLAMLALTLIGSLMLLRRLRAFEAVKLGQTV